MISPRIIRELKREFRNSLMAKLGVIIILLVLICSIFAPFIAPHNPNAQDLSNNRLPPVGFSVEDETSEMVNGSIETVTETTKGTITYPLGTDLHGRDILSRLFYGARTSLLVGITATLLATIIGATIGLIAGYSGGLADDALMRFADIMLAFPSIVLAIAIIGTLGPAAISIPDPFVRLGLVSGMPNAFVFPGTITIVIALIAWVWFARVARGEALSVREEEYVKAAKSFGASDRFIIWKHILPNSFTPILVLATTWVAFVILIESALSFLGFSGTTLSWGFDIAQGRDHLATSWWIATIPGIAIMITVIGVNLLGDWLRDALDPGIEGEEGGF